MIIAQGPARPELRTFLGWVAVGFCGSLAVLSPFTVGPFAAAVALAGAVLLIWRRALNVSSAGILPGAALIPLYIAYLNRHGPGQVCRTVGSAGTECTDAWNPWPFFAIGVLLIAAGAILFVTLRRQAR